MVDSVSVDLPDDDQQLNRTKRTFQYGVDLSLYLRNTTLNFMVRKKNFWKTFSFVFTPLISSKMLLSHVLLLAYKELFP